MCRRYSAAIQTLSIDSVVLVPVSRLAEPVACPVRRSSSAQPKYFRYGGPVIAFGSAGAWMVGGGGGCCAASRRCPTTVDGETGAGAGGGDDAAAPAGGTRRNARATGTATAAAHSAAAR